MNANPKNTLLLIDGHSLAFRAFYALSPDAFRAPSGQHTNAVHGFIDVKTAHAFAVISAVGGLQHAGGNAGIKTNECHNFVHGRVAIRKKTFQQRQNLGG